VPGSVTSKNVVRSAAIELRDGAAPGALRERYAWRSFRLKQLLPLQAIGVCFEEIPPGRSTCPLHYHLFEEEHFYVVSGSFTVRELEQGGTNYREFEIAAGDLIAFVPGTGLAHQFFNRGDEAARFIGISNQHPGDICRYPDGDKIGFKALRAGGFMCARGARQSSAAILEAAVAATAMRRVESCAPPAHVARGLAFEVTTVLNWQVCAQSLSRAAGGQGVFLRRERLAAGASAGPLHRREFAEEVVVVLTGALELHQRIGDHDQHIRLDPADVVHWSGQDGIAHELLNRSDRDSEYLVIGNDPPHDICHLVDTGEIAIPGANLLGTLETADYWIGT